MTRRSILKTLSLLPLALFGVAVSEGVAEGNHIEGAYPNTSEEAGGPSPICAVVLPSDFSCLPSGSWVPYVPTSGIAIELMQSAEMEDIDSYRHACIEVGGPDRNGYLRIHDPERCPCCQRNPAFALAYSKAFVPYRMSEPIQEPPTAKYPKGRTVFVSRSLADEEKQWAHELDMSDVEDKMKS